MTLHSKKTLWTCIVWAVATLFVSGCAILKQPAGESDMTPTSQLKPGLQEERLVPLPAADKPDQTHQFIHTVKWPGETLSYISKWYTGKYANWQRLAKVNPNINPNVIRKGHKIAIPERLLKKRTPLPKNFIARLTPKKKTAPDTKAQESEAKKAGLPLFGPK